MFCVSRFYLLIKSGEPYSTSMALSAIKVGCRRTYSYYTGRAVHEYVEATGPTGALLPLTPLQARPGPAQAAGARPHVSAETRVQSVLNAARPPLSTRPLMEELVTNAQQVNNTACTVYAHRGPRGF